MQSFIYFSFYITSLIKMINKKISIFFYNSIFINQEGNLNSRNKIFSNTCMNKVILKELISNLR